MPLVNLKGIGADFPINFPMLKRCYTSRVHPDWDTTIHLLLSMWLSCCGLSFHLTRNFWKPHCLVETNWSSKISSTNSFIRRLGGGGGESYGNWLGEKDNSRFWLGPMATFVDEFMGHGLLGDGVGPQKGQRSSTLKIGAYAHTRQRV